MRTAEIDAIGKLAADALAAGGDLIGRTHDGIAGRPFGILGPMAAPVRVIHDAVAGSVYLGIRSSLRTTAWSAAQLAARRPRAEEPPLGDTLRGGIALGILNGFYGDYLQREGSELALSMTVRRGGRTVSLTPGGLREAFPHATPRIAVFLHGLCETDVSWRLGGPGRGEPYGVRLERDLGYTSVHLRYNTGRHISDNGQALARLLERLADAWPRPVREIALVGHSMGGLVARSACHAGERHGLRFTRSVRHVFCLGTPHLGADLERGVNVLAWALAALPETRALAVLLNARSTGIKDLRFGAVVQEDWDGHNPDEYLRDRCREVPFLDGAAYCFVGATLREGPLGHLLGDLLVRSPSASGRGNGRGRAIRFEVENGCELTGLTHFDLLNHPDVYRQLHGWLARTPRPAPALLPAGTSSP